MAVGLVAAVGGDAPNLEHTEDVEEEPGSIAARGWA